MLVATFDGATVVVIRHYVFDAAMRCPMTTERRDDFVLAVNEIMANVVRHGGGTGRLRLWRDGDLVCQVTDNGPGFDVDPILNGERPRPAPTGGMGLWLVRQTTDKLTIQTGSTGTTIRIRSHLGSPDGR
ncbi:ATP-binding protein [Asanoa sp. NPDC049518]|uniref:ATP-binding protein n=1 Tax=unclassified Asanoa TaxID=2685164 RepID=UPI003415F193